MPDSQLPLQPDAIRTPGEPVQLTNPLKFRYYCACTPTPHVTYLYFDQLPPDTCPAGKRMYRDGKWQDPNFTQEPPRPRESGRTNYVWGGYEDQKKLT